jgi:hypothetical protein
MSYTSQECCQEIDSCKILVLSLKLLVARKNEEFISFDDFASLETSKNGFTKNL